MEAGNPEWGWGCSAQSFFIVWGAWSSTALPTQVGCSDAFSAPSSRSPECSISAFASFLPTTFRHHLSNHNQPTPPCWEVSASPANPGKAAGWLTARHAVGFWQGEALTLRCVWLLQAQVGLWWWKSKTTAVKVCHEQNAATCKSVQKMKSWCRTRVLPWNASKLMDGFYFEFTETFKISNSDRTSNGSSSCLLPTSLSPQSPLSLSHHVFFDVINM